MNTAQTHATPEDRRCGSNFTNPIYDSQQTFRAILNAFSSPGHRCQLKTMPEPPYPLSAVTASCCLTLFDSDTFVWLAEETNELIQWLKFYCGAPLCNAPDKADFAIINNGNNLPELTQFRCGTPESPDKSVTLLIEVESLSKGETFITKGPGIKTSNNFSVTGLNPALPEYINTCRSIFPMGLDAILTDNESLVCLTRTTTITRRF